GARRPGEDCHRAPLAAAAAGGRLPARWVVLLELLPRQGRGPVPAGPVRLRPGLGFAAGGVRELLRGPLAPAVAPRALGRDPRRDRGGAARARSLARAVGAPGAGAPPGGVGVRARTRRRGGDHALCAPDPGTTPARPVVRPHDPGPGQRP